MNFEPTRLPLAFSQVREDARLDAAVLAEHPGSELRAVMIASGGDTAAWLCAGERLAELHLVDANPAQLALTRLKLRLLAHATPTARRQLLGHEPMTPANRVRELQSHGAAAGVSLKELGPISHLAEVGPDHAGRYEWIFAELRAALAPQRDALAAALALFDPAAQTAAVAAGTALGEALASAFDRTMSLERLVAFFGPEATRNPRQPFPDHFLAQTRECLRRLPARDNPFIAQFFLGRFQGEAVYPWLAAAAPHRWPALHWHHATMQTALAQLPAEHFDFVHLSNILDWLSPADAAATLDLAHRALRPGGRVFLRQLNSTLEIMACGPQLHWLPDEAAALLARDQSFFYRALHLAEKKEVHA